MNNFSQRVEQLSPLKRALLALEKMQAKLDQHEQAKAEPIAIIGMGCRFPGAAHNPEAFWQLLQNGQHTTTELPCDRWDIEAYYDPEPGKPGKMYTRYGCFLREVDQFDADFFGISPREAVNIDPQQRLLLEVSWEALEEAGQVPEKLKNSQTGVYVGIMYSDYDRRLMSRGTPEQMDLYTSTGNASSFVAGRLSYLLGLQGPSMVLDTACSSSLVSVHLACQSLRSQECDLALAGGVNLILLPEITVALSQMRALAPDGLCKTFDASADGYTRGEGCGMIVLKRLNDALADQDQILGVIRGSAVNHNGPSSGLTVPNGLAQQALIKQALANAQVQPHQVSYVEAHGTGTALGDPIEIRALGAVYGQSREPDNLLWVSSVKTNIGHLESAAGIAGLIKVVLALQHAKIPPHLHLQTVNPHISLSENRMQIPLASTDWQGVDGRRIAGLSSFGLSGTNAHLILEAAPQHSAGEHQPDGSAYLFPLSAQTPSALQQLAYSYQKFLATTSDAVSWGDICYNASIRRSHHRYRLSLVGKSRATIQADLQAYLQSTAPDSVPVSGYSPQITFIFTDSPELHWREMGRQLVQEEVVFSETLEQCDRLMQQYAGWSVLAELTASESQRQSEITVVVQIAVAALWCSWGIQPEAIAGYGLAEIAAAYVAGVFHLDAAIQLLVYQVSPHKHHQPQIITQPAHIPIYSHLTGQMGNGQGMQVRNWGKSNITSSQAVINCLIAHGCNIFIEISPQPVLTEEITQCCSQQKVIFTTFTHIENLDIRSQLLTNLGKLYTLGCRIEWGNLYHSKAPHLSLLTYPWQRQRYWLDFPEHQISQPRTEISAKHPLLGYRLRELAHLAGQYFWEVELDTKSLTYLRDHRVQGKVVLPGAAYLEMALSAAKQVFGSGIHYLQNVAFQKALFLPEKGDQTIQLLLAENETSNTADFKIFSRHSNAPSSSPWVLHAAGKICLELPETNTIMLKQVEIETIQKRCQEKITAVAHYQTMSNYGLNYGPCFQGIQQIWRQDGEVFAQIQLPETLGKIAQPYQIHPVLLDSAFQSFGAARLTNHQQDTTYLPVGLSSIKVYGRLDQKVWSHLLLKPETDSDPDSLEADIFLLNQQGEVILEVQGFRGQKLDTSIEKPTQPEIPDWFYEVQWQPQPENLHPSPATGHWLIFVDTPDWGEKLGNFLAASGDTYTLIYPQTADVAQFSAGIPIDPADSTAFEKLLAQYLPASPTFCPGIVYCWGAANATNSTDVDLLGEKSQFLCSYLLHLTQAIIKTGVTNPPRLWIVTQGTQGIANHNSEIFMHQSALWGLGKVIIQEHPELRCTLVDVSPENLQTEIPTWVQELKFNSNENHIAWRGEVRYVARLVRSQLKLQQSVKLRSDATYLITGGMGGLGLTIAEWMVQQGARHLALIGRRGASTIAQQAIAQMEKAGATVKVFAADVSVTQQVADVIATIQQSMPPLRGVIHAAAVLDDGILLQLNSERLQKVMAPKILGAGNLHTHTRNCELDHFVLFSSVASLMGSPGQGNYSAANAFLDTLAHYRRSHGFAGLSINWGAWSQVGMAATQTPVDERFSDSGFGYISPSQGLETFAQLLQQESAVQVGVLPANWQKLRDSTPALAELPLLSDLMTDEDLLTLQDSTSVKTITRKYNQLTSIDVSDRLELLTTWLREYIAQTLRLPTEKLDPQQSLNYVGLDSLIAIELKNWIESQMKVSISMADLLQGPSVTQLANQILVKFNTAFNQQQLSDLELHQQVNTNEDWEDGEI
ncbi:type I polyketide synthase [Nodularia sp. UHCC 0506]|uniref:type I polyketide synthase n=1 Tax=Nodularia sp. UHCC 0506 TaxID=3110243 RepID=UPI002B1EF36D|nr:type I polyketide synthase [Nodularia sp. UHCC 0506]MEA5516849.1 type I polyketide synthase [Nodularia sp. UHCC 0506]